MTLICCPLTNSGRLPRLSAARSEYLSSASVTRDTAHPAALREDQFLRFAEVTPKVTTSDCWPVVVGLAGRRNERATADRDDLDRTQG